MSDMIEIDVPDWVVFLAGEAYVNHGGEYSRFAMERALTAALGAWLVPKLQGQLSVTVWADITAEEEKLIGDAPCALRTLYTLRQEELE